MKQLKKIILNEQVLDAKEMKQIKGGTYNCIRYEGGSSGTYSTISFDSEELTNLWASIWQSFGAYVNCYYSGSGSGGGGSWQA